MRSGLLGQMNNFFINGVNGYLLGDVFVVGRLLDVFVLQYLWQLSDMLMNMLLLNYSSDFLLEFFGYNKENEDDVEIMLMDFLSSSSEFD